MRNILFAGTIGMALVFGTMAHADDEAKCLAGRAAAQAKYQACVGKWLAKVYAGSADPAKLSKCQEKYSAAWGKLSALAGSVTCSGVSRFTDNGTTVTDNLTGLVWEKKTTLVGSGMNASDRHDVDNLYSWANAGSPNNGSGVAYTDFLSNLNSGGGFVSANDWRLPTLAELLTLVNQPYPCAIAPCIYSPFGATQSDYYYSATTRSGTPSHAWSLSFGDGSALTGEKTNGVYVRAVRGGL